MWNNLRSTTLKKGQQLNIYISVNSAKAIDIAEKTAVAVADSTNVTQKKNEIVIEGEFKYYTIQQGDTLWDIAKAHGVSVEELKRLNNMSKYEVLKPGKKIKLGLVG